MKIDEYLDYLECLVYTFIYTIFLHIKNPFLLNLFSICGFILSDFHKAITILSFFKNVGNPSFMMRVSFENE